MRIEYLKQADAVLSKCGRPQMPGGVSAVPLYRGFMLSMILQPGATNTFTKEIQGGGGAPWVMRAISSDQTSNSLTGIRCQIQLPNGRFLFGGNGVDVGQIAWVGSWRWNQDPELRCETGSKIQVTLTDTTSGGLAQATAVNLLFEGAFLHFMKGGAPSEAAASQLPRYQGTPNQNILAPVWASNEAVETPPGFVDEYFIYSTPDPVDQPLIATWQITAGAVTLAPSPAPFELVIDPGYTFFARRILVDLQLTGSASAVVMGRLRTGAGYVVNDLAIDLARYLCGAEYPKLLQVAGGDSVFIDCSLADVAGTGTATYQVILEGFRRRAV
jgi:hypothetical protein